MAITDDLKAFNLDPTDANQVAGAIATLAASPAGRLKLIREWELATNQTFPQVLREQLLAGAT